MTAEITLRASAPLASAQAAVPSRTRPLVALEDVAVRFGRGEHAVTALAATRLAIAAGDFVCLVGPSGCGKSTILRLVSGLLPPSSGTVIVAGREVGSAPVRIGMAYQNATLLPWLTVRQNVMLPLKIVEPFRSGWRRNRRSEYRDRAEALLAQVGLGGFGDKYPWQLSGGMQQRTNLCRALIHEPDLLLLDEPFGALDQFTREELWATMQELWLTKRTTVLLVTHDLREAAYLGNRICVMSARPGRILEDCAVAFPRPRPMDVVYEPEFVAITQRLRALITGARMNATGPGSAGCHAPE